jgi:hypothetical protein
MFETPFPLLERGDLRTLFSLVLNCLHQNIIWEAPQDALFA